jgi:hypothetical protein
VAAALTAREAIRAAGGAVVSSRTAMDDRTDPALEPLLSLTEALHALQRDWADAHAQALAILGDLAAAQTESMALLVALEQEIARLSGGAPPDRETREALRAQARQARLQARRLVDGRPWAPADGGGAHPG